MFAQLDRLEERFDSLEQQLGNPDVLADPSRYQQVAIARSALEETVKLYRAFKRLKTELDDTSGMLANERDSAMRAFLEEERTTGQERLAKMASDLRLALLPRDPLDDKDTIVEIRAGTGGDEAALFAAELFRMYTRYIERHGGWKVETLALSDGTMGGFKEAVFKVSGAGAFGELRREAGVHRVQRVPATESAGRIHTSAATVAVLPEAEDVDVSIEDKDLRVDVYRASGPGGQGVNTTDSAVRITHLPTGIVVTQQDQRSQIQNKAKAMEVLRSRLLDQRIAEQEAERSRLRRSAVSTGDRSAKIRTYNFPQSRITDHRINFTTHDLQGVLEGKLSALVEALRTADLEERLAVGGE